MLLIDLDITPLILLYSKLNKVLSYFPTTIGKSAQPRQIPTPFPLQYVNNFLRNVD